MNVFVVGGGNLAHAFVGELGNNPFIDKVSVISRRPEKWQKKLDVYYNHQFDHSVEIETITSSFDALKIADVIVIALPAHVRNEYLIRIKDYIPQKALLIAAPSVGGINFIFDKYLPNNKYACLQRVPYICRTIKYGTSVNTEVKKSLEIYFSKNATDETEKLVQNILRIPYKKLDTFWTLMLSNSNPILHIAGVCEILRQNYPYTYLPKLYDIWTDFASDLCLKMDSELASVMSLLKVSEYRTLLEHYQVKNTQELTTKLKTIESFKDVLAPLKEENGLFYVDENSRYIQEDLLYGTCFIKYIASILKLETPNVDYAIKTVQQFVDDKFIYEDGSFNVNSWKNIMNFDFEKVIRDEIGI